MRFNVFCRECLVELDYEDLHVNWCSYGNHTLIPEFDMDYSQLNERCMIW